LQSSEDGSVTIYLGHNKPGSAPASNWLPTPSRPFELTLQMYAPKAAIQNGS
jgi:hypothetical protein